MHSLVNQNKKYAVIGVSKNPEKYGHRVFKDLLNAGWNVYAVNPSATEVLGNKVYPKISDINDTVDVAIFVVPPQVTFTLLNEVKDLGIKHVWLQPGSESPEAIEFCRENNIECIHDACVMIERKSNG